MATSPRKQDFASPRLCWRSPTFSWRIQELMSVKLRIQEEAQLSKDTYRSTVSLNTFLLLLHLNILLRCSHDTLCSMRTHFMLYFRVGFQTDENKFIMSTKEQFPLFETSVGLRINLTVKRVLFQANIYLLS